MAGFMIHAELKVRGCIAELYINDIPLKRLDSTEQNFISIPVNQYVRIQKNVLTVVVFPGPTPARCRESQGIHEVKGASAQGRLVTYNEGDFTGGDAGEVSCEVKWEGSPQPAQVPIVLSSEGSKLRSFGSWSWETAPPLSLQNDKTEILSNVQKIHALFRDGNGTELLKLMRTYIDETVRAFPVWSPADLEGSITTSVGRNPTRENGIEELHPDKFSFRLCADGRLVECIDENWLPIIRSKPQADGWFYPFPIFLGRTPNGLQILR